MTALPQPSFVSLYVSNPGRSAAFYGGLFGVEPVETSPTFVLFRLASGLMLGLWDRAGVLPAPDPIGHGAELGIPVANGTALSASLNAVRMAGHRIVCVQQLTPMSFGHAFTFADPAGHPIRVFAVARPSV